MISPRTRKYSKCMQSGFSLIEVLISLLIIGISLMGLGGLQVISMKGTTNAHSRTVATMYAVELSDRMRANPSGVKQGFYGTSVSCSGGKTCRSNKYCTPQELASFDIQEVMCGMHRQGSQRQGGIANSLLNGTLDIACVGPCAGKNAVHNINITWGETKVDKDQTGSVLTQNLLFSVIP